MDTNKCDDPLFQSTGKPPLTAVEVCGAPACGCVVQYQERAVKTRNMVVWTINVYGTHPMSETAIGGAADDPAGKVQNSPGLASGAAAALRALRAA